MPQHGFFFDQSRCCGCKTCSVACKSWHALPPGPLKYLRVYEYEKGVFPNVRMHYQWVPCYHCEHPVCAESCPTEAIRKEEKYGAVLVDQDDCIGCRACYETCPYGAPVFESDESEVKARKCDMCIDRLERGDKPICVMSCPTRALDFGELGGLQKSYGTKNDLEDMPSSRLTEPAIVVSPSVPKRQLVPYDGEKAVRLIMRRDPLPAIFTSPADLTDVPAGTVGRSELVIKHGSAEELMRYTRNDEG